MNPALQFPLVLVGDGQLELVGSLRELASSLEGIDVTNGLYRAFDASGRVIELLAEGVVEHRRTVEVGRVRAHPTEPPMFAIDELVAAITGYLGSLSEGSPTTGELVAIRGQLAGRASTETEAAGPT